MIPGLGISAGEGISYPLQYSWASLVAQLVKNLPAMWETWVRSLGWEDPLERERLPTPVFWLGEFHGLYSPRGHKESYTTKRLSLSWLYSRGWMHHESETISTAAAAAKLLHSCLTLCDPIDGSPPGSPVPGILQARTLEWVAISFSNA